MRTGERTGGLEELHALLGRGAEFEGKLVFEGRVRIEGRFVGEVASDGVLIIGEQGSVEGSVRVGTLIVLGGTVRGDVYARQSVELHAPARVYGDIHSPELLIDKGVTFEGKSHVVSETTEPKLPETATAESPTE